MRTEVKVKKRKGKNAFVKSVKGVKYLNVWGPVVLRDVLFYEMSLF